MDILFRIHEKNRSALSLTNVNNIVIIYSKINIVELDNKDRELLGLIFIYPVLKCLYKLPESIADFAYSNVNKILAENRMDYEEWHDLQELLPEVEECFAWDKCKRLRLGMVDKGYQVE